MSEELFKVGINFRVGNFVTVGVIYILAVGIEEFADIISSDNILLDIIIDFVFGFSLAISSEMG